MNGKFTTSVQATQHLIAEGLEKDRNIKFIRTQAEISVSFQKQGKLCSFEELDPQAFVILANAYNSNATARGNISHRVENGRFVNFKRQVEIYTYFLFPKAPEANYINTHGGVKGIFKKILKLQAV